MAGSKGSRQKRGGSAGTGRKVPSFAWAERAARLDKQEDRHRFIDNEVPEAFRATVREILPHFLVGRFEAEKLRSRQVALVEDACAPHPLNPDWQESFIRLTAEGWWRGRRARR